MKNLEFLRKNPIAHRGLWNKKEGIPENSIPAFEKAIQKEYPIELDIHLLKDGKAVVFHDDNLHRMTGVSKKIKDCTYEEIRELNLGETSYKIPLFSEVLQLVKGKVPLLIELKHDRKVGETEKVLMDILKDYDGEYAVQCFNPNSLIWFRKNFPETPRGQLSKSYRDAKMIWFQKWILRNMYLNFLSQPDFVSYEIHAFPNKRVEKFRKTGKLVLGWTAKTNQDLEIAKNNCDNIIGENFEMLDMQLF